MLRDIDYIIDCDIHSIERDIFNNFTKLLNKYEYDCFIECYVKFRKTIQELTVIYGKTEQEIKTDISQIKNRLNDMLNKK